MRLTDELKTCSDTDLSNAILVALATHKDARVKNLASGYDDAEIRKIAVLTPVELLFIAETIIDIALKALRNRKSGNPEVDALAMKLKQEITDKQQLDALLSRSLHPKCMRKNA